MPGQPALPPAPGADGQRLEVQTPLDRALLDAAGGASAMLWSPASSLAPGLGGEQPAKPQLQPLQRQQGFDVSQ